MSRTGPLLLSCLASCLAITTLLPRRALAARKVEVSVPSGGGLRAMTVRADLDRGVVEATVEGGGKPVSVPIERTLLADASDVKVELVAIGQSKTVAVVHVPTSRPVSFDVVLAGEADAVALYSGVTGYVSGQPGSMTGQALRVVFGQGGARFVVTGDLREDDRICGQTTTLLSPRVLDAQTLTFRGASVQQISGTDDTDAARVVATALSAAADKPLGHLLTVSGASVGSGSPQALVDGDLQTTWSEARGGAGRGEFVSFSTPSEVPIARLALVFSPPSPSQSGAAPKSFFLATEDGTYKVTMPEDAWLHPGAAYEIAFTKPLKTTCLSLVLDEAYVRAGNAKPEVTVAEVMAYGDLESKGATLDLVALALAGGGARAEAAAGLLKRAGEPGTVAVTAAYDKLDAEGRARAIDVASSVPCGSSATLLVRALVDADEEVRHKAEGKLERCGKASAPAMTDALKGQDFALRSRVATLLALVAPAASLDALAAALAEGPKESRTLVRHAFATAARSASADKLAALLDDPSRKPEQKLEILRALGPRLAEVTAPASSALTALLAGSPSFAMRYLSLEPLGVLAHAHDAASVRAFAALLAKDPEAPVRARAAELAPGIAEVQGALTDLLADADPRVRDAAVRSITALKLAPAAVAVGKLLATDPWTFVRVDASLAFAALPPSDDIDSALATSATKDASPIVRAAAISALGVHVAKAFSPAIRDALENKDELVDVRVAAARALGSMCDAKSFDTLTELAKATASPVSTEDELSLGFASIEALGRAHPADLQGRIGAIAGDASVKAPVRAAVRNALQSRGGSCGR